MPENASLGINEERKSIINRRRMSLLRDSIPLPKSRKLPKTIMILEENLLLHSLYANAFETHGWQVVGQISSPLELLQSYLTLELKPQVLITEYFLLHSSSEELMVVLREILKQHPDQQILFVTGEEKLINDSTFLPSFLQHIPIILKTTHTVEELVQDLVFL
jgi:hypothetical protein